MSSKILLSQKILSNTELQKFIPDETLLSNQKIQKVVGINHRHSQHIQSSVSGRFPALGRTYSSHESCKRMLESSTALRKCVSAEFPYEESTILKKSESSEFPHNASSLFQEKLKKTVSRTFSSSSIESYDSSGPFKQPEIKIQKSLSQENIGWTSDDSIEDKSLKKTFSSSSNEWGDLFSPLLTTGNVHSKNVRAVSSESSQEDVAFALSDEEGNKKASRSVSPTQTSPMFGSPIGSFVHFLNHQAEFDSSLFGKDKKKVDSATQHLRELPDSPTSKIKGKKVVKALKGFWGSVVKSKVSPKECKFHQTAHATLQDSPWAKEVAKDLRSEFKKCKNLPSPTVSREDIPGFIINIDHIIQGGSNTKKAVGFHFCPEDHPMHKNLLNVQVNPENGVFCSYFKFDKDKEFKFSSFFPKEIKTEDEIIELILNSEEIASEGNRSLRKVQGSKPFLIEVYFKEQKLIVNSAFPIFYSAAFEEGKTYQLTEKYSVDSATLLKETIKFVQKNSFKEENLNPIRFTLEEQKEVIVDVAPIFEKQTGIKNGIYFRFPVEFFPSFAQN